MDKSIFLTVDENQTIEGIQRDFTRVFPFLRLEFFNTRNSMEIPGSKKNMYTDGVIKLSSLQQVRATGKILLNGKKSAGELENEFDRQFGLSVQVFRKSGNIWLETSATDSWTLDEQNSEAESLQSPLKNEQEDLNDHDVW